LKVVILAGGRGTRISEETDVRPKPMVEIGGKPILWHIMKIYSHYGFNDFIICCGYKGYLIKEYFHHYYFHHADLTVDLAKNSIEYHHSKAEPWRVTLVDTGINTMTGGRIKRIKEYTDNEPFLLTYGDGLSDININKLIEFHRESGKKTTLSAVQTFGRFGALEIDHNNSVSTFIEKPKTEDIWINGGFFVCEQDIFEYITDGDATVWERKPLESLSNEKMLAAFKHTGFWKPMDHLRDKIELDEMWNTAKAPWKVWQD
jgi:glucose-1-phosphate cytidylyltransferase